MNYFNPIDPYKLLKFSLHMLLLLAYMLTLLFTQMLMDQQMQFQRLSKLNPLVQKVHLGQLGRYTSRSLYDGIKSVGWAAETGYRASYQICSVSQSGSRPGRSNAGRQSDACAFHWLINENLFGNQRHKLVK